MKGDTPVGLVRTGQGVIRLKGEEISFLRGHLSQLSEKLPRALPPTEKEIRAKH
jgi:hypothetical protein